VNVGDLLEEIILKDVVVLVQQNIVTLVTFMMRELKMALSIFDPATGINQPTAPGIPIVPEGGISSLLGDRNFLALLAGIGQNLDPKGAGGIIGGPTRALIASQAAQDRAATQAAAQNAQTRMVIEALQQRGGLTPKDQPGVTSVKSTPTGVQMEITPENAPPQQDTTGLEGPTLATPTTPQTTLTPSPTPSAPSPVPGVVPGTGQTTPTVAASSIQSARDRRLALLPFYSRLLGAQGPWQA
jgi:hypothetical protein